MLFWLLRLYIRHLFWKLTWEKWESGALVTGSSTTTALETDAIITITDNTTVNNTEYKITNVTDANGCAVNW